VRDNIGAAVIKLLYCLRRLPDLSLEEFQSHWLKHHGRRYGLRNDPARLYVLYATLGGELARALPSDAGAYDGVAAVWLDDRAAVRASMESPNVAAAVEDEKRFINHDRSVAVLTEEHVVVEPDGEAPVVLFECLARRPELDAQTFVERWLAHAPLIRAGYAAGLLQGGILNVVVPTGDAHLETLNELGTNAERWDGIATTYFDSVVAARRFHGARPDDLSDVADEARTLRMLTQRHPMKHLVR
jgi:hypothetical protein